MDLAIEKGLQAEKTKIGPAGKKTGYTIQSGRLKVFLLVMFSVAMVLLLSSTTFYQRFVDESLKSNLAKRQTTKGKAQNIRLGMMLQAKLQDDNSNKEQELVLNRINKFTARHFDMLIEKAAKGEIKDSDVREKKIVIQDFIQHELADWKKDAEKLEDSNRVKLEKIAKMQEQALRNLLLSVSGVRLEALEDMLNELFEDLANSPQVILPASLLEVIDALVDRLYSEEITFEQGLHEWKKIEQENFDDLHAFFVKVLNNAVEKKDGDELADAIDVIAEAAKLSKAREELTVIHDDWQAKKKKLRTVKDEEEHNKLESELLVETALAVQRLVNEGQVPMDSFDFESLELEDDYADTDD